MKFGVISSRSRTGTVFEDSEYTIRCLDEAIDGFNKDGDIVEIISGGGKGPETHVIEYGNRCGFAVSKIPPKSNFPRNKIFIERNRNIVNTCDILVVFWAGDDSVVPFSLRDAAFRDKKVIIFPI